MKQTPTSLKEIQKGLINAEFSMVEIVNSYLKNIEASSSLNIYIEVYHKEVLSQAKKIDKEIHEGRPMGALTGCVLSVKDVIAHKGHSLTAASKILEGYVSPYSATAINRLIEKGAVIIGRTNCDEFGMGSSNENSIYGITKNGNNPSTVPGGSSGGAAVSVQMNTCLCALGSDTGGSVRQPASFCGVYGLKPTYGRISRYGLIAYASSFDQIGILGHNTEDILTVLKCCEGKDTLDATSASSAMRPINNLKKLAYFPSMIEHEGLSESVKENFIDSLRKYKDHGYEIIEAKFDYLDYLVPTYYILTTAEASTNLSRYDGVRYGYRSENSDSLENMYVNTRSEGFGKEVKRRIMLGTYVLSEGYFDAYYTKAQRIRRLITNNIQSVLEQCDALILPTSTSTAWKIGEMQNDPIAIYLSDVFTVLANLTGMPAISIPSGNNSEGKTFGIQLLGKKHDETTLLSVAKTF